jgi:serine/threonine protein kinase
MQGLIQELGRYIAGTITSDEFRGAVRTYLEAHPDRRDEVADWFKTGVQNGRLSPGLWDLIADLFSAATVEDMGTRTDGHGENGDQRIHAGGDKTASPLVEGPGLHALEVGAVLLNRYRLVEELGRGGMGQVFKAVDRYLEGDGKRNPFIALKALNATYVSDASARSALLDEAMRAKTLSHDNIVRVDNFDWDGPYIFITMEYLRGNALDVLMRREYAEGLPVVPAWEIIEKIGDALDYAHRKGVIHSDVKPSNIFITKKDAVKVLDFGISRLMARSAAIQTETQLEPDKPVAGLTPAYASLEQWRGEKPDPRDDIYSFALVVYELLTGQHPFAGAPSVRAFEVGLEPPRIETLSRTQWEALRNALELSREARTKTVKEFLRSFAPPTLFRKYRVLIGGGGAAFVAAAIATGSHVYSNHVEQQMLCAGPSATTAGGNLAPAQRQQIDDDLFLAKDYLHEAKIELKPDDLAYVLSEGANNVNQILDSVLRLDAGNSSARHMKAQIAALYLRKARELQHARQLSEALKLVRYGLKVTCNNLDLFHMQRDICEQDSSLCAAS